MKKFVSAALAFLLVFSMTACSAGKAAASDNAVLQSSPEVFAAGDYGYREPSDDAADTAPKEEAEYAEFSNTSATSGAISDVMQPALHQAKLIYSAELEMETLSFEESHAGIEELVNALGGYFENKSVRNAASGYRRGEYTVRVPADKFRDFLDEAGTLCLVTYAYENADDVSEHYYDTEARLTTARAKLERLQELLRRAESVEDIITIEHSIADTEYTIDSLSGTLRNYDSLVDYATIRVNLREVYQLSNTQSAPITFGERLGASFTDGLTAIGRFFQNLVLWLAYSWFWLVIAAAIILVTVRLAKKKGILPRRRMKNKKETEHNNSINGKENE